MIAFTQRQRETRQAYDAMQAQYRAAAAQREPIYLKPKADTDRSTAAMYAAMQENYHAAKGRKESVRPDGWAPPPPEAAAKAGANPEPVAKPSVLRAESLRRAWRVVADVLGDEHQKNVRFARVTIPKLARGMFAAGAAVRTVGLQSAHVLARGVRATLAVEMPVRTLLATAALIYIYQAGNPPTHHAPRFEENAGDSNVTQTASVPRQEVPPPVAVPDTKIRMPESGGMALTDAWRKQRASNCAAGNNPGNIERTNTDWEGKKRENTCRFEMFETPQHGLNAMARNLVTYDQNGVNSVAAIVNRWAPSKENKTALYITGVAEELGVAPHAQLNVKDPTQLHNLMVAMIHQEHLPPEQQRYTPVMIDRAVAKVLGPELSPGNSYAASSQSHAFVVSARDLCQAAVGGNPVPTSSFGMRWGRKHEGQDCMAPEGAPIYNILAGNVKTVYGGEGYNGGWGKMLKICNKDEVCLIYAHAKKIVPSLQNDRFVKPGRKIGLVGSTGHSTGSHLHLQLQDKKGRPIDMRTEAAAVAMGLAMRQPTMR